MIFVTPTTSYEVVLTREQALSGLEIEEPIVADVVSFIQFFVFFFISEHIIECNDKINERFANMMNSYRTLNNNDPIDNVPLVILPFKYNVVLPCRTSVEF